ncbi:hypothetical protein VPH35_101910 [Triticum aestivum]
MERILIRAYACHINSELDRRRRHLYVLLEERNTGHSIYKLNIDDLDGGDEEAIMGIRSAPFYLCRGRDADEYDGYNSDDDRKANDWAWRSFWPFPLDRRVSNSFVRSYAVYPDGHTIFASSTFTFSIDTYRGGEPTRRGDWHLPFHGRAYYDGDLDAWVDIRAAGGPGVGRRGCNYLCSCDIPSPLRDSGGTGVGTVPPPAWKVCKQELGFHERPVHGMSQALVHTGRSRFCLVESMPMWTPITEQDDYCSNIINDAEHLLLVTMFRAKHGKNGELVVTPCRPSRSYLVPNHVEGSPTAFWM